MAALVYKCYCFSCHEFQLTWLLNFRVKQHFGHPNFTFMFCELSAPTVIALDTSPHVVPYFYVRALVFENKKILNKMVCQRAGRTMCYKVDFSILSSLSSQNLRKCVFGFPCIKNMPSWYSIENNSILESWILYVFTTILWAFGTHSTLFSQNQLCCQFESSESK